MERSLWDSSDPFAHPGTLPQSHTERVLIGSPSPWITITRDAPQSERGPEISSEVLARYPRGAQIDLNNMAMGVLLAAFGAGALFLGWLLVESWLDRRGWMPAPAGLIAASIAGMAEAWSLHFRQPGWTHCLCLQIPVPLAAAISCWAKPRVGLATLYVSVGVTVGMLPIFMDAFFPKSDVIYATTADVLLGWLATILIGTLIASALLFVRRRALRARACRTKATEPC